MGIVALNEHYFSERAAVTNFNKIVSKPGASLISKPDGKVQLKNAKVTRNYSKNSSKSETLIHFLNLNPFINYSKS